MGKAQNQPEVAAELSGAGTRVRGSSGGRGAAELPSRSGSPAVGRGSEAGGPPACSNSGSLGCPNQDGTGRDAKGIF